MITVRDCLKVNALKDAKIIAGKNGIDRFVTSVSVLEYAELSFFKDYIGPSNEIVISAFANIKDDINMQLKLIESFNKSNFSALILYYVGIFLPEIDSSLIDYANKMDFPIIIMPENNYDISYSDVISDIYELIIKEKNKNSQTINKLLEKISYLNIEDRNIHKVLELLSRELDINISLVDRFFNIISYSSLNNDFIKSINCILKEDFSNDIVKDSNNIYLLRDFETIHDEWLYLLINSSNMDNDIDYKMDKSIELIKLYYSIWENNKSKNLSYELVKAIFSEDNFNMRRIAKEINFNIEKISKMWIVSVSIDDLKNKKLILSKYLMKTKEFISKKDRVSLVNIYNGKIVIMLDSLKYDELDSELINEYLYSINGKEKINISILNNLKTVKDVRINYLSYIENERTLRKIYPLKNIFYKDDINFTSICNNLITLGDEKINEIIEYLLPIFQDPSSDIWLETLYTVFLDSNFDIEKASEILFLHRNTISYRLKRIEEILGYNFHSLPARLNIYIALSLYRIFD